MTSYGYDANGSLTTVTAPDDDDADMDPEVTSMLYDEADHTASMTTPAGDTLDMTNQGPTQDERDTKTVTTDTGSTTTAYGYDVIGVAWEETDSTTLYTRTPGGKLLGRRTAGTGTDHQYYTLDHLGSVRDVTDASGGVVQKYTYQPYGRISFEKDDTFDNPWQFAQGYFDTYSELQKHGVRYYDDDQGRFTQLDEVLGDQFTPITLNRYQYANCDPANNVDPRGHLSEYVAACLFGAGTSALLAFFTSGPVGAAVAAIVGCLLEIGFTFLENVHPGFGLAGAAANYIAVIATAFRLLA